MTDIGDDTILRWHEIDRLDDATRAGFFGAGAPFEIRTVLVHGSPCEVFPNAPTSVCALIASGTDKGDRPFLTSEDDVTTFAELPDAVGAITAELRRRGVTAGDRVLYVAETTTTSIRVLLGVVGAGAIIVPVNPRWGPGELSSACEVVDAKLALVDDSTRDRLVEQGVATALIDDVAMAATEREPEPPPFPLPMTRSPSSSRVARPVGRRARPCPTATRRTSVIRWPPPRSSTASSPAPVRRRPGSRR